MIIHRKIKVKTVVTEEFRNAVLKEIQEGIKQLDTEISYFEQRAKKTVMELTIKASPQVQAVREQFEWEKKKREDAKNNLLEQMNKVSALKEGTEVLQGEVEGPVEVRIGDAWDDIIDKEIVLKDGMVIEIR